MLPQPGPLRPRPAPPHRRPHPCRLGIPDSRIILMLADQPSCSPRNVHPGRLYLAPGGPEAAGGGGSGVDANLQAADAEVDYVGREVGVEAVLRVLTGAPERGGVRGTACGRLRGKLAHAGRLEQRKLSGPDAKPIQRCEESGCLCACLLSQVHTAAPAGRHPPGTPASKRLQSGPASRVLLYLTGHGGDEFLKFHDQVGL